MTDAQGAVVLPAPTSIQVDAEPMPRQSGVRPHRRDVKATAAEGFIGRNVEHTVVRGVDARRVERWGEKRSMRGRWNVVFQRLNEGGRQHQEHQQAQPDGRAPTPRVVSRAGLTGFHAHAPRCARCSLRI